MKIASLRQVSVLLPAILPLPLLAADNTGSTMVVSAAPAQTGLSELDTPAAVSVVSGEDMRQAAPRVNLSENLGSVPGLQIQNRQSYGFGPHKSWLILGSAWVPPGKLKMSHENYVLISVLILS